MERIPRNERVVIGADYNSHVREGSRSNEQVWYPERTEMAVVNTFLQKRQDHRRRSVKKKN